jgi:NifU-like protein involved in Fe-S cluster formation
LERPNSFAVEGPQPKETDWGQKGMNSAESRFASSTFSPQVWAEFRSPHNRGSLPNRNGEGWAGSRQAGQFVRIQILLTEDRVQETAFETFGCLAAIACSSYLTRWATQKSTSEITWMDAGRLEQALGGLPQSRAYCAEMAVHAMRRAVQDAGEKAFLC